MEKAALRKLYNQKRQELTVEQINVMSEQIAKQLKEHFELAGKKVSVFMPIERFNEVNTHKIISEIDATYVLPIIKHNDLIHIVYESAAQLKVSDWGIPEPTYGEEIKPSDLDVVLVPLLAVDEAGNRVGYGKGFYDRFLNECEGDCQFIGLSFFEPISAITDVHSGDIALDYLVTPNKIFPFN